MRAFYVRTGAKRFVFVFDFLVRNKNEIRKRTTHEVRKRKENEAQYETKTIAWMSLGGHAAMRSRPGWAGHRRGVEAQGMCVWIIFVVLH